MQCRYELISNMGATASSVDGASAQ
ncbi:hypothetical protein BIW11_02753 [Tropilaelaps mercedesae]|uniref:Uncharacterized protein n=1 Tax=Tropilaelaps mercedesae TaxID=418985 RepID=A0A1V9XXU3_9ACAR|nr:hypothetical protein BIW11_02753 [Tropilaelaps mercedesae]